jgi:hypothetical protein
MMEDTTMSPRLDQGIPDAPTDPVVPEQLTAEQLIPEQLGSEQPGLVQVPEPTSQETVEEIFDQLQLPEIPPYDEVGPVDARAMSKTLFKRLEKLEEHNRRHPGGKRSARASLRLRPLTTMRPLSNVSLR